MKDFKDILEKERLKENPFGTPQGYFESMRQEVMEKISATPVYVPEKEEPATFMTYFKPAFALAAVFAIVFGMGYGAMYMTGTVQDEETQLQAQQTLEENATFAGTEISEDELIYLIGDTLENLYAQESSDASIDIVEPEINKEEIEQYLIDTRISTIALALLE
ncbi:MAG: hypothetical protein IJE52_06385 [Bacteroidales bacterium]|nr:hypothetical protein [Bacteroidales bacterium]MBQ2913298.1 hypothetical protein [Bacteroidales bacterium]MBR2478422.1 hypothetical protein [Bacteroidales bacterium]